MQFADFTIYRTTGPSPSAPPAPPDPRIAEEEAKQEAIAIAQARQRRLARFESSRTRPGEIGGGFGPAPGADIAKQIKDLKAQLAQSQKAGHQGSGNEGDLANTNNFGLSLETLDIQRQISAAKKKLGSSDLGIRRANYYKDQNVAALIEARNRRLGVTSTRRIS